MSKLSGKTKAKSRKKDELKKQQAYEAYKKKLVSLIKKFDDPSLSEECLPVSKDDDFQDDIKLVRKVLGCTKDGIGLAANQIGIAKRIIAVRKGLREPISIMINPEIISHSDKTDYRTESCLSYPGVHAPIERYVSIEVEYYDEKYLKMKKKFKEGDIEGIIIQHEIDHLNGRCALKPWWEDFDVQKEILDNKFKEEYHGHTCDNAACDDEGCDCCKGDNCKYHEESELA